MKDFKAIDFRFTLTWTQEIVAEREQIYGSLYVNMKPVAPSTLFALETYIFTKVGS